MTAAVWLPSTGAVVAWCVKAIAVVAVLAVVSWVALGRSARRSNR